MQSALHCGKQISIQSAGECSRLCIACIQNRSIPFPEGIKVHLWSDGKTIYSKQEKEMEREGNACDFHAARSCRIELAQV